MPVNFISGDLFVNRYNAQALAHGCNCKGVMGAGIAVVFRKKYPGMYREYRRRCRSDPAQFGLGQAFLWKENGRPLVFNLGTQERPGPYATCQAVENALSSMLAQAMNEKISSIAMPRIGAGLGGLDWEQVREIIEKVFGNWSGTLYVYEEYKAE